MTHWPFIAAAYGLTLALFAVLSVHAAVRLARARRRLAAVEAGAGRRRKTLSRKRLAP